MDRTSETEIDSPGVCDLRPVVSDSCVATYGVDIEVYAETLCETARP